MGFFNKILDKLGFGKEASAAPAPSSSAPPASAPSAPAGSSSAQAPSTPTSPPSSPTTQPGTSSPAAPPQALDTVDVVAQLEARAAQNPQKLNWKTSIVDLLKLLDIDSSLAARKELATELGCPPELMEDSAQMNMWLHKAVLARIAQNGGNVPKDLLD